MSKLKSLFAASLVFATHADERFLDLFSLMGLFCPRCNRCRVSRVPAETACLSCGRDFETGSRPCRVMRPGALLPAFSTSRPEEYPQESPEP